jgi:1-acyl-sn-glycerol-3-phosphate acyltransferase
VLLIPVYTLVLGTFCLIGALVDRSGRWAHAWVRLWSRLVLWTAGVRVSVSGLENVPPGPALFAANHSSALDIPILFAHLPARFRIIHKKSLYLVPMVGWILYAGGHIGIDRGKAFRARKSLEAAAARIRGGTSVLSFPEGTRSPDGAVRPFKRGSFVLALNAGVPVVPVSLAGVKRVIPRGILTARPGVVRMTVHPALTTAGRGQHEAEALAEQAREVVVRGCEELAV